MPYYLLSPAKGLGDGPDAGWFIESSAVSGEGVGAFGVLLPSCKMLVSSTTI